MVMDEIFMKWSCLSRMIVGNGGLTLDNMDDMWTFMDDIELGL